MASKQTLVLVAAALAAVAFLPALAAATEHWVGDNNGWKLDFNYSAWAETKQFKVGDTLVFKYTPPKHTVVELTGADFKTCNLAAGANALTTGQDKVTLDAPGRRWFACGVGSHCQQGMKIKITVLAADETAGGPSVAPPPASSPAPKVQACLAQAIVAVTAVIAAVFLF